MVGNLYRKNDLRRDQGFTIFYIGINFGAFFASIIVGYVGEVYGWHFGFSLAGLGMVLGQIIFISGRKNFNGNFKPKKIIKTKYQLNKIEIDRIKLIRSLRLGEIDIMIGINLLREGLDIPECGLVAILDADKEGFLRSKTSLVQTLSLIHI